MRIAKSGTMHRLRDKVALVTGSAGRIGRAVAARLAREGARVVVADLLAAEAERVARTIGADAISLGFDAADVGSIQALVDGTIERLGRIDVLHNNHAYQGREMMEEDRTALDTSFDLWDRTMAINLRGYFATCKFAIPHMVAAGGGSIINMASGAGLAGDDSRIAYGTSKAAIIGLSRYIATQHGKQRIRSNCVAPGFVADRTLLDSLGDWPTMLAAHTLTPRHGTPDDVAAMVVFLASDEAGYITGQCYQVDGGMLAHQPFIADLRTPKG